MGWLRKTLFRLQPLFRKGKIEAELTDEIRSHLEMQTEANVAAGMPPEEARFAAQRQFGGVDQIKERFRDQRGFRWLENTWQDLRYAGRQIRLAPGFAAIAILTVALGIGACTAVFSVINTAVLHPFSYPDVDRLVVVYEAFLPQNPRTRVSPGAFGEFQRQATSFSSLAAAYSFPHNVTREGGDPIRASTQHVTANFFATLGVQPILGRDFRPDEMYGKGNVVILSHRLWLSDFGGVPGVIGQTVFVDGQAAAIIGVMPADFQTGSAQPRMYAPYNPSDQFRQSFRGHGLLVIGRLKAGVTPGQAVTELGLISNRLAQHYPDSNKGWSATAVSLVEDTTAFAQPLLYTLLGAVGFLLLIACVNIANLLLARATARQKEIAIRLAVGASRGQVMRQLVCESLLLSALGGALGVLLAQLSMKLMLSVAPADLPRLSTISVDGHALGFSCLLVLLTGFGFGLVPAVQATRVDLNDVLKDSGRGTSEGRHGLRLRTVLVISEVALALILLVGAGLLVRSFLRYQNTAEGFQRKNLYLAPINLSLKKYPDASSQANFVNQALERISNLHGITSACFTVGSLTVSGGSNFTISGLPAPPANAQPTALGSIVTPGYLKTMGIPLLRGREFTPRDSASATPVIFINEELARVYFPGRDPIGQRINIAGLPGDSPAKAGPPIPVWREIVGVSRSIEAQGIDSPIKAQIYIPYAQVPVPYVMLGVRIADGVPLDFHGIAGAIHSLDKDVPFSQMWDQTLINDAGPAAVRRFSMALSVVFSGIALLLAAIGIYGVMAFSVAQRTGEIGIRMALGAQQGVVLQMILRSGGRMVGFGLLVGVAGALATTRLLSSLLYNVSADDPMTLAGIILVLALVGFLACWLPARRATKVDPLVALRSG